MSWLDNKYLIAKPGSNIKMTPKVEPIVIRLDKYFEQAGLMAYITRVLSDADDQLAIIRKYLIITGLDKKYPDAMYCKVYDKVGNDYVWQMAWSNLLNVGIIINPPLEAVCLMDYIRNKVNRKGMIIRQTPHVHGGCFDVGGRGEPDAEDPTIKDEAVVLNKAKADGVPILILLEHKNNCCHCDVK